MSYFFAKAFTVLINPNNWFLIYFFLFFLMKKGMLKKRIMITGFVLFIFLTNGFVYKTVMKAWQPAPVVLNKKYDVGVLLAGISSLSLYDEGYFGPSADRFIQTVKLYHSGKIDKVIISGGDGTVLQNGFKESVFLKKEMIASGVPDSLIFIDAVSRNTNENAVYTKMLCDSLHIKQQLVLITSAWHMRRATMLFQKKGIDIMPFPCNYEKSEKSLSFSDCIIPDLGLLQKWNLLFKEIFGMLFYQLQRK